MDTLKQDRFLHLLENAEIDLVVVDEAHKLSKGTDRYKLGEVLSRRTKFLYFLTATPHRGDDEDYIARMRLLDPYVTDVESARYLVIRNLKDDVIDLDGKEVFPPRESKTIDVPITEEEMKIHKMLDEFIARKLEQARLSGDSREINSVRFLGIILRKRASSSLYALKVSLENRIKKLSYDESIDVEELIRS
jgi:ERCC4-related helicase